MKQLVECVPNISEGRDRGVIDAVTAVIAEVAGVRLLDVDPGADTNRTVITFIGPPDGVAEAAFRVVKRAGELIDMRRHKGAHPRHGSTDVCPFVPVRGITMDECAELARRVGRRIGDELGFPVYLYEAAATRAERRNLAYVRKGEYEALCNKLGTDEWRPDFGPNEWNERTARSGAINVSARGFLVAYNVNLNTRQKKIAGEIALDIKESGRAKRDPAGKIVKDSSGETVLEPGPYRLAACKAVGWVIPQYDRAQVSINLVDTSVTKPHQAFEACRQSARDRGVRVTGSELVGLIPEGDLLAAGKHYLKMAGQSAGVPRRQLIETAVQSLGLGDLGPFDPAAKVIEYQAGLGDGPLVSMTGREFVDELSSESPAPGGGSVSALCAAQSAALVAMVGNLTVGKKSYQHVQDRAGAIAERAQELKDFFLDAIDLDTEAFNRLLGCFGLPKATADQQLARDLAVAEATRGATRVPLSVLDKVPALLDLAAEIAEIGNQNSLSDAGVAVLTAMAAAEGAYYNVVVNLAALAGADQREAPDFAAETREAANRLLAACEATFLAARGAIRSRLERI
ncbi:MAG TPA: glutamate formimidoyltransferase [Candidatus Krumholzibacteria bacterium]|nr:glutamate formimidoyltransferase [Candidatus Krumholzibacteria bacterium]HPD71407.1 glutamate formimidoyltransferase [Candidatus Krumholzibacteria bacterium]HRY41660.1 glutamate formimidoyltransferase [Candidatus Krumholzibacteria bacterium]